MKKLGIEDIADNDINEVSGGQLQRACICRSMINAPGMIFADEPTGALNRTASEEVMEELCKLNAEGTTIMCVTHDAKVAAKCSRVLYIVDGIDGMEGNGPTAGEKRHVGVLLSSKRPYALDMVCADIIGMTMNDVATIGAAYERGLGPKEASEAEIVGKVPLSEVKIPDFQRATSHQSITFEGEGIAEEHMLASYNQARFRVKGGTASQLVKFLMDEGVTQHYALAPGSHLDELRMFAEVMGFRYCEFR